MPVGMLLMMLYENCVEYAINNCDGQLDKDNPLDILTFYGSLAFYYIKNIKIGSIFDYFSSFTEQSKSK